MRKEQVERLVKDFVEEFYEGRFPLRGFPLGGLRYRAKLKARTPDARTPDGLPRYWKLFSYILPHNTRKRVFEPAYQEMFEDYLETRGKYRTKWAKRWLAFTYTVRTAFMVLDCFRALVAHKVLGGLQDWFRRS